MRRLRYLKKLPQFKAKFGRRERQGLGFPRKLPKFKTHQYRREQQLLQIEAKSLILQIPTFPCGAPCKLRQRERKNSVLYTASYGVERENDKFWGHCWVFRTDFVNFSAFEISGL